jgi:hypothetical protein
VLDVQKTLKPENAGATKSQELSPSKATTVKYIEGRTKMRGTGRAKKFKMPEGTSLKKLINTMSKKFDVPLLMLSYRGQDNAIVQIENNVQFQLLAKTMKPLLLYCEVPAGAKATQQKTTTVHRAGERSKKQPKRGSSSIQSKQKSVQDTTRKTRRTASSQEDGIPDSLMALEEGAQHSDVQYDPRQALFAAAREAAAQAATRQSKRARDAAAQEAFKRRMHQAMQELRRNHQLSSSGWVETVQDDVDMDRIEIVSGQKQSIRQPPSLDEIETQSPIARPPQTGRRVVSAWAWEYDRALAASAQTAAACAAADAASFAAFKCMQIRRLTAQNRKLTQLK